MKRKTIPELVSKETRKTLRKNNTRVLHNQNSSHRKKYTKLRTVYYQQGYDFLELLILVRPYIKKKYKISTELLDILLYLGGKKIFMQADLAELPKQFTYSSIRNLLKTGFITVLQDGGSLGDHVFTLTTTTKNIFKEFYGLLSGELKFPEDNTNPLKKSTAAIDKKRMQLIKKINAIPAPEKNKPLYL
jgi:hypothetical protein